MSETAFHPGLSPITTLPAVIPPTTRFNFIKNWWHRSEKTSNIAEARMIKRIYDPSPALVPIAARVGRISLDDKKLSNRKAREINTLYISQQQNQTTPFQFESEPTEGLLDVIKSEANPETKNLVMCHGYGAGLGFFYRNYQALSQVPGYRLFSIDWLGMGRSSRPKWTLSKRSCQTWDEIVDNVETHFVQSLEDWREKVGLDKMTLVGHSLGGYFAACYALQYPHRVEKLILVSPAGIPEDDPYNVRKKVTNISPEETLQKEALEIGASLQADAAAAEAAIHTPPSPKSSSSSTSSSSDSTKNFKLPAWVTYLWNNNYTPMGIVRSLGPVGASLVHTYTSRRFAHLEKDEQHDIYDYLYNITSSTGSGEYALAAILAPGAVARKPLFRRLAGLKMPTVFIYGEYDWMDFRAAEKAKRFMSVPAKVVSVPYGGHHMYLDNPDSFNDLMKKILSQ